MEGAIYGTVTDWAYVSMSRNTLAYLESIDPDWYRISINKRLRSKHAKRIRDEIHQIEMAAVTLSKIAYHAGDGSRIIEI